MRVIVTGSRHYTDVDLVRSTLIKWSFGVHMTLVHGAADGLDLIAARIAGELEWAVEAHPAAWAAYGSAAGPRRNQEMVDLGARVCIAFPLVGSRGTWDCVRRAHESGIPVEIVPLA